MGVSVAVCDAVMFRWREHCELLKQTEWEHSCGGPRTRVKANWREKSWGERRTASVLSVCFLCATRESWDRSCASRIACGLSGSRMDSAEKQHLQQGNFCSCVIYRRASQSVTSTTGWKYSKNSQVKHVSFFVKPKDTAWYQLPPLTSEMEIYVLRVAASVTRVRIYRAEFPLQPFSASSQCSCWPCFRQGGLGWIRAPEVPPNPSWSLWSLVSITTLLYHFVDNHSPVLHLKQCALHAPGLPYRVLPSQPCLNS